MAIDLDPEFTIAYVRLGAVYHNLQQRNLSDEYLRKAFERREHISEREKFYVQAHYYQDSTGEEDKAIETYELWTKVYPHDWIPFNNLSNENVIIGNIDKAIAAAQEALRLNPNHAYPYASLAQAYLDATRFAEAKAVCEKAAAENHDSWQNHGRLYQIALIEGDEKARQRESNWFRGNPFENFVMYEEAEDAMSRGKVREARKIFERARASALQHDMKERANDFVQEEATEEADLGYIREGILMANTGLPATQDSAAQKAYAALALARAGDLPRAEALADEASKEKPLDLLMNNTILACVRATVLARKKNAAGAIVKLQPSVPYDFGSACQGVSNYYRGYAFLQTHSAKDAAAEFEKMLDNRGVVSFYWPLAHLGLARAYGLSGDTDKSLAEYRQFLELWKDADPDVPILKQAKAEYAKLQ
jgi:eukaryotic-like serine/threonine-protein kinase